MLVILTMLDPGYVQSYKGHKNVRTFLKEIAFLGGNDYVTTGKETRLFNCCSWRGSGLLLLTALDVPQGAIADTRSCGTRRLASW
jgi:hypothetical protein